MKTITEIRRNNLQKISETYESQREFADVIDMTPAYLNQLLTGHRAIGEKTARKIEDKLKVDKYKLDAEHNETISPDREPKTKLPTPREQAFIDLINSLPTVEQEKLFRELEEKERYFKAIYEDMKNKTG
jgi:transcriptional regulator with XRE-family HTH domain